jgi:hypothetical protein
LPLSHLAAYYAAVFSAFLQPDKTHGPAFVAALVAPDASYWSALDTAFFAA